MEYSMGQRTGTAAIVSFIVAIGSYVLTFSHHPVWGIVASLVGGILGIVGLVSAASPRVSGGVLSIAAIVLSVIALAIAILGTIGAILF